MDRTKTATTEEEAFGHLEEVVVNFPESAIKNKVSKNVITGTVVTFTIDGSALEYIVESYCEIAYPGNEDIEFKDANIVAIIAKDGTLISENVKMTLSITVDSDQEVELDAVWKMDIKVKFGAVEIEFPNDLDSYEEVAD
jgi:hypothetical protein